MNTFKAEYRGEWLSFGQWCDRATMDIGPRSGIERPLCIDAMGRVCFMGKQFMRARDEGAFPVKFYECAADEPRTIPGVGSTGLDDGPYLPGQAPRKQPPKKTAEESKAIRAKAWETRRAGTVPVVVFEEGS